MRHEMMSYYYSHLLNCRLSTAVEHDLTAARAVDAAVFVYRVMVFFPSRSHFCSRGKTRLFSLSAKRMRFISNVTFPRVSRFPVPSSPTRHFSAKETVMRLVCGLFKAPTTATANDSVVLRSLKSNHVRTDRGMLSQRRALWWNPIISRSHHRALPQLEAAASPLLMHKL